MNKWLGELNKLVAENPEAQLIHMVSEEANNGEYSYATCHDITVNLTSFVLWDETLIIDDEDEVKDKLYCELTCKSPELNDPTSEELDVIVNEEYERFIENNPWNKAIFINVG